MMSALSQCALPMTSAGHSKTTGLAERAMQCLCSWYRAAQVSRKPDIGVGRIEGQRWTVEIDAEPVPKFGGVTIDIHLNWDLQLTFDEGDFYTWGTV